jgi:antitoxin ChpS
MKFKIIKCGNDLALRVPKEFLNQIGATIGDNVEIDLSTFSIVKPKYKLTELLAECDANAPLPNLTEWDEMPAVGKEIIK